MTDRNVCSEVVANNLCIGCGVCAAICPRDNLKIRFNEYGEYNAFEIGSGCLGDCNLCLSVCPFHDNEDNEDTLGKKLFADVPGIKHTPETGYYLDSFVGYSNVNGHRENGASGGMATWTLETLLKENLVDYVMCVSPKRERDSLFSFVICKTPEEVRACSKSCYYPVETSRVLKYILENDGRYALIGLPCVCKAIRLAMQFQPRLRQRVTFLLGLTCGQAKSKFFAEYACAMSGGNPRCLSDVVFRTKVPGRPASDFTLTFCSATDAGVRQKSKIRFSEGVDRIWCHRYFTPNACNFCDDVFAELADVCFMDAWLPGVLHDHLGHNITLIREPSIVNLCHSADQNGHLTCDAISIERTIASQRGQIKAKQWDITERLRLAKQHRLPTPAKRGTLPQQTPLFLRSRLIWAQWQLSLQSRKTWVLCNKNIRAFRHKHSYLRLFVAAALLFDRAWNCLAKRFRRQQSR